MIKASRGSPCSKEMFTSDIEQLFLPCDSGRNRSSLSSSIIRLLLLACEIPLAVTNDFPFLNLSTAVISYFATLADWFATLARSFLSCFYIPVVKESIFVGRSTALVIGVVSLAQLISTAVPIPSTFLTALSALPFLARLLSLISKTLFGVIISWRIIYICTAVCIRFATLTS